MAEAVRDVSVAGSIEAAPAEITSDIPAGQAAVNEGGRQPSKMDSPSSQPVIQEAGAIDRVSERAPLAEESLAHRASTVLAEITPSTTPAKEMTGAVQPSQVVPSPAPPPASVPAASTPTPPINGASQHPPSTQPPQGTWRTTTAAPSASQPPIHQFRASAPAPIATQQYAAARPLPPQSINAPPPPRPQADPIVRHKMTSNGKLFISEPPSKRATAPGPGFRSPDGHGEHNNHESGFDDEVNRLTSAMTATSPAAVRRVVRDSWQRTLLGTDFHQAFIVIPTCYPASAQ
jgi:hypothetical protein